MPEHLLTLKEASDFLGISAKEITKLVKKGEIPAYKIGGEYIRFRKEQLLAVQKEILSKEKTLPARGSKKEYTARKEEMPRSESIIDRFSDFFYFNDFYIFSATLILIILWIIFKV